MLPTSGLEIAPLPVALAEELSGTESGEFAVVICLKPEREACTTDACWWLTRTQRVQAPRSRRAQN